MMNNTVQVEYAIHEKDRFAVLYAGHQDLLRRMARMMCGDLHLADDLLQETWIRAWRALDSLHEAAAARSWLITILKHEHARLFARKQHDMVEFEEHRCGEACEASPEQGIYLRQLLATLDDSESEPLLMQVIDGCPVDEIAARWNISCNAMSIRLHRVKKRLACRDEKTHTPRTA